MSRRHSPAQRRRRDPHGPDPWEEARRARRERLRSLTLEQGVLEFLALCNEFGPELDRTDALFRSRRWATMRELQEKLARHGARER